MRLRSLEEESVELAGALQAAVQDRSQLQDRLSQAEAAAFSPRFCTNIPFPWDA